MHLGHGNPPGEELHRRLATVGCRGACPTAACLLAPAPTIAATATEFGAPGACSSPAAPDRESPHEAERRLAAAPEVIYVATAEEYPGDEEWSARLAAHRARRPAHWSTVETGVLAPLLRAAGSAAAHRLSRALADPRIRRSRCAGRRRGGSVSGRSFWSPTRWAPAWCPQRRAVARFATVSGRLNARIAAEADEVWHCVAGVACRLK